MMEKTESVHDEGTATYLGRVVGGFQLERRLGAGASGEVWLGRHQISGGLGAAKILRAAAGKSAHFRDYFAQEWRIIRRLDHPNVVRVFASGAGYLVTAFVEGIDLARRLRTPIQPGEALDIALQVASALDHAHERGVIHRDVKPGNILMDRQGNAFLADFGLARLDSEPDENLVIGTPGYMAPEQTQTSQVGPAADQYALARVLMEMLVGQTLPLDRDEAMAEIPAVLPTALREALERATRISPGDRFPSVAAFARTLRAIDLGDLEARQRLARVRRDPNAFGWVADGSVESDEPDDIWEASYSLQTLAARGHFDKRAFRHFNDNHNLRDASWSVYGRTSRLGGPLDPGSHARATDLVVLLHGGLSNREIWSSVARTLSQRNAQTLVLVPDIAGHGRSPFLMSPKSKLTTPRSIATYALELLSLLQYDGIPTVLVGHSMSAVAMLTLRDDELGPLRSRVAVSPVFPAYDAALRRQLRIASLLVRVLRPLPWLLNASAWLTIRHGSQTRQLSTAAKDWCYRMHLSTDSRSVACYFQGLMDARCAPGDQLKRSLLLHGKDDPLLPQAVLERAARDLRIPAIRIQKLATGGHQPQLEIGAEPGCTAQNREQIVHAIESMMIEAEGESGNAKRASGGKFVSMAHGSTLLPGDAQFSSTKVEDQLESS